MNSQAAIRRASALAACWPGRTIAEPHVLAWAEELARWPDDVVEEALDGIRYAPDPPSVGYMRSVLREVVAERTRREQRALPLPEPSEMPSEVRERLQALRQRWAQPVEREAWRPTGRLPGTCDGAGQEPVWRDGHAYCPACGEDVDPECPPERRAVR